MRALAVVVVVLAVSPARAEVDQNAASLVTELVSTALATDGRFEVVSSADLRRQMEVEANKQTLGCDANVSSCLAEIAGAMGAQLVVYGRIGALDDVVILTLNLFDSGQGKSVGRVAVREKSLSAVSDRVDGAVKELVKAYAGVDGKKAKLLVLDVEAPKRGPPANPDTASASVPDASAPWSPMFWGGIGGVVGGVAVGGVGVALYFVGVGANKTAAAPGLNAVQANDAYNARDLAGAGCIGGVALGLVGVVGGSALMIAAPPGEAKQ